MPIKNTPSNFSRYPLVPLAACFMAGIAIERLLALDSAILISGCALFGLFAYFSRRWPYSAYIAYAAFLFLGAFCLSVEISSIAPNRLKVLLDSGQITSGDPVEIEGVLLGNSEPVAGGFQLTLKAEKISYKLGEIETSGNLRLFAALDGEETAAEYYKLNLGYGSRIRIACNPMREDAYLNPGVMSRREILDRQEIDATAAIKSPLLIEKLDEEKVFLPLAWVYEQRANLITKFNETFDQQTAGVLNASLLGNKYFLDKRTADVFREGGTFHVLVISGLHVTFIGGLVLLISQFFTKKKLRQFIIVTAFLWAYAFAVGAEVPVVRASLMFTILLFSQVIYRQGTLLNSLSACILVLLIWRPSDLFYPSFQLTIASVGAIIVVAFPLIENLRKIGSWMPNAAEPFPPNVPRWLRRFCETLYWNESVWNLESARQIWSARLFKSPYMFPLGANGFQRASAWIFEGLAVSVIVQFCLLPFLIVYFHRVSPVSILLNLWVSIFIALESFSAVITVFLGYFSEVIAFPFARITEFFNLSLIYIPSLLINGEWVSWRVPVYSGAGRIIYFAYFFPIFLTAFMTFRWNPFSLTKKSSRKNQCVVLASSLSLIIIFAGIIILHPFSAPPGDGRLQVDFLDVGQGDSAFITFPNGQTMLIDGGGRMSFRNIDTENNQANSFEPDIPRIGEMVVSEFIWEKGYSKIDYILTTHSDVDHIQGIEDVSKNFVVKQAFFGTMPAFDKNFADLAAILQKKNIPFMSISQGVTFSIGGALFEVLYPVADDSENAVSDNNHSVVFRMTFGEKSLLFTGDVEQAAEKDLLNFPAQLKADVIKVPHHGSRTSSSREFVNAVNADYAIISVGRRSIFGHPNSEVVDRWTESGAEVMTTGSRGTTSVSTDGRELKVDRFIQ